MKYVKIVRHGGSYNGIANDHPTYVIIDIQTLNQSDIFFDSYAEAKKYCDKKGFRVVNQQYSLDWNFNLKNVEKFLENYKKVNEMKPTKLTPAQIKLKKVLQPIVEGILKENYTNADIIKSLEALKRRDIDEFITDLKNNDVSKQYVGLVIASMNRFIRKLENFQTNLPDATDPDM